MSQQYQTLLRFVLDWLTRLFKNSATPQVLSLLSAQTKNLVVFLSFGFQIEDRIEIDAQGLVCCFNHQATTQMNKWVN